MSETDPLRRVDALVDDVLPPPRVRQRLRLAAGLSQSDVAEAVGVKRLAVARWELGQAHPRKPHRQVYSHFLKRLAERYPHVAQEESEVPDRGRADAASELRGSG